MTRQDTVGGVVLSKADVRALENLSSLVQNAMRSKTILKVISSLQDRGLVAYDPFRATATLTDAGRAALKTAGGE